MLRWFLGILGAILAVALIATLSVYLAVRRDSPAVPLDVELTEAQAINLRAVLSRLGDTRTAEKDALRTVTLSQADIDAAFTFATSRVEKVGARATATDQGLQLQLSAASPYPRLTPYVDVRLTVTGAPHAPRFSNLKVGALALPDWLAQDAVEAALAKLRERSANAAALLQAIEDVRHAPEELTVSFRVTESLSQRLQGTGRRVLTAEVGKDRLEAYHEALAEALRDHEGRLSLADLLRPLFVRMKVRTDTDPLSEIRAALLVAAFYVVERSPNEFFDVSLSRLPRRSVRTWGRSDLPKHFLVSAFVAAWGDRALADALGLSKELTDAEEGGSGFSFVDLAADRAGTQLVERALSSEAKTQTLIAELAEPKLDDAELLPDPRQFPEGLSTVQLEARGWKPGSAGHQQLVRQIDARLETSPLHNSLAGS